ncbi:MAG: ABC transporter ATP-binding protein [Acidimicrobiales bacterium]
MSDPATALRLEGVEVRYGGSLALRPTDLEIAPGARVAVVGRNGAGKSTLLRAVAGTVAPSAGRITWGGSVITRWPVHRRVAAGISLVPEGRRTFAALTVGQNLAVGAFAARRQAAARLELVHQLFPILATRAALPAAQLSGGESQMLAIGQALMAGPRLILLDEPSIGLAPVLVRSLLRTMHELAATGIAVLLVEQSVRLAAQFAERLHVLDQGRLLDAVDANDEAALRAAYFGASAAP